LRARADQVVLPGGAIVALRGACRRRYSCALLHDLDMVPLHDMPDLVPEHARELGLVVQDLVEAARDEYVAARRRESIDAAGIENAEVPRQVRALALGGD